MTLATAKQKVLKEIKVNIFAEKNGLRTQNNAVQQCSRKLNYIDEIKFRKWLEKIN